MLFKFGEQPLLFSHAMRHILINNFGQHVVTHGTDGLNDFAIVQQSVALRIHHAALVIGNVIVLKQLFAHIEVACFDFTLGRFNRT